MRNHLILLPFILIFSTSLCAQEFHEEVLIQMVQVCFNATKDGKTVSGLKSEDFLLKEDGVAQSIVGFSAPDMTNRPPLTISLLIDNSGSMIQPAPGSSRTKLDIAKQMALTFLGLVQEDDAMSLFSFNRTVSQLTPLTSETENLKQTISAIQPKDSATALYDAIKAASENMREKFGQKVIVVCTDGQDNQSHLRSDDMLKELNDSDVTLFVLVPFVSTHQAHVPGRTSTMERAATSQRTRGPGEPQYGEGLPGLSDEQRRERKAREFFKKLTEDTGGTAIFIDRMKEIDPAIEKLRGVITGQYCLWYKPNNARKGWHEIDLKSRQKGIKIACRNGYFSD